MTSRLLAVIPMLALALLMAPSLRADFPQETSAPASEDRPSPGSGNLRHEVLNAYRGQKLFSGEDYYAAAAVLAAEAPSGKFELAADLALAAMEKGFRSGYRVALAAHRRFAWSVGIRRAAPISVKPPKSFKLSPKPRAIAQAV
jgi:hypothetical protein